MFWEAWQVLQRDFFGDQPADQQRTYAAIQGLAQSYDDPYTYFVEPQPRQREKENLSGEFIESDLDDPSGLPVEVPGMQARIGATLHLVD